MHRGHNRARSGADKLASLILEDSSTPVTEKVCIFLSHISVDKQAAIAIADYIMKAGFDVYLDVYDPQLQIAAANRDDKRITEFIERGLNSSTNLICLLTNDTMKSWWVPYELGFGKSGRKALATLRLKATNAIPSYLTVVEQIGGIESLNQYLAKLLRLYRIDESQVYKSFDSSEGYLTKTASGSHPLLKYLDSDR